MKPHVMIRATVESTNPTQQVLLKYYGQNNMIILRNHKPVLANPQVMIYKIIKIMRERENLIKEYLLDWS